MAQRLAKHQAAQPTPIRNFRADCPEPIVQLCTKMMAKKPNERVQRMQEIVAFCQSLLPKLPGTTNDLVGLAGNAGSKRKSRSDSSYQATGTSYMPAEAGFETLLGSDAERPTSPDFSSQTSDLSFLADALPLQQAISYVAPGQASYWQQAAQAKPAAAPRSKFQRDASKGQSRKNQIILICGLLIACLSVGLTLWQAFTTKPEQTKPDIRTYEDSNGGKVIVVRE